jgi:RNA polymerase sigma-70 factor (ECF subfamily)
MSDSTSSSAVSDDLMLLAAVARGDGAALLELHARYANQVYSMACRVLGDAGAAEEVTQDVFLKLWRKSARYDPARGRFSTWLLSVTRFAAIDRLRADGRRPTISYVTDENESEQSPSMNELSTAGHADWEQGQQLRLLIEQLPADQRQVIELAYFGGLTHSEMAEQLGLPLGTVKGRLRLGLEKLRGLWLDSDPSGRSRA